jgi:phosphoglycolate phosphatase
MDMPKPPYNGVRHVVWDWNGTLLDDADACIDAINRMLRKRSLPPVDGEQYRAIFGFPVKNYYVQLGFDFARESWDALAEEYHDYYAEASKASPLHEGAVETLERIRGCGLPMSILSASEQSRLEAMTRERGVRHYFQQVGGLTDLFAESKVEVGRRIASRAGVPAGETLMVGDTTHDFEVASALGWRCVLVAGGHQAEQRLRNCACPVYAGMAGVLSETGLA